MRECIVYIGKHAKGLVYGSSINIEKKAQYRERCYIRVCKLVIYTYYIVD